MEPPGGSESEDGSSLPALRLFTTQLNRINYEAQRVAHSSGHSRVSDGAGSAHRLARRCYGRRERRAAAVLARECSLPGAGGWIWPVECQVFPKDLGQSLSLYYTLPEPILGWL